MRSQQELAEAGHTRLVLTRREDEEIVIEPANLDRIIVRVVEMGNGKVRIAIEASRDTKVNRLEVYEAKW